MILKPITKEVYGMKNISIIKIKIVKENFLPYGRIQNSEDAADIIQQFIGDTDRENFVVLFLNTKNKINGINLVSVGSLNASIVHPREVFKPAILANASAIIVGHNHPSGDTHGIDTQFVVFSTNEKQETIANYSSFISASDLKK